MPIIKSAIKRMKQTAKRQERNVGIKRDIKSAVKNFLSKPTSEGLSAAHSELDTAVKKKLMKKKAQNITLQNALHFFSVIANGQRATNAQHCICKIQAEH